MEGYRGVWRFFTMFEPKKPLSPVEAASKFIGAKVDLDGELVRVSFVGRSRVSHLEGITPEGETVGREEHYFNAVSRSKMVVVSWLGSRMEYYHGNTLPTGIVEKAFGLPQPAIRSFLDSNYSQESNRSNMWSLLRGVIILIIVVFILNIVFFGGHFNVGREPAIQVIPTPAASLKMNGSGQLNGKNYRIIDHRLAEDAEVGYQFNRHEYVLKNDAGETALLIFGERNGSKSWWLVTPLHPIDPITPYQAGAIKLGDALNVDGMVAKAEHFFRSTFREAIDAPALEPTISPIEYGFCGLCGKDLLMVRWSASRAVPSRAAARVGCGLRLPSSRMESISARRSICASPPSRLAPPSTSQAKGCTSRRSRAGRSGC
jgi:hypothetical protein